MLNCYGPIMNKWTNDQKIKFSKLPFGLGALEGPKPTSLETWKCGKTDKIMYVLNLGNGQSQGRGLGYIPVPVFHP